MEALAHFLNCWFSRLLIEDLRLSCSLTS
jgi:hypothetical protein